LRVSGQGELPCMFLPAPSAAAAAMPRSVWLLAGVPAGACAVATAAAPVPTADTCFARPIVWLQV